jgi:hypothetical protein
MKRALTAHFAPFIILCTIFSIRAQAADCVQSKTAGNPATIRKVPTADGEELGQLTASAPLIAIIPRWYETRTPAGDVAFVSKVATKIATCAGAVA